MTPQAEIQQAKDRFIAQCRASCVDPQFKDIDPRDRVIGILAVHLEIALDRIEQLEHEMNAILKRSGSPTYGGML